MMTYNREEISQAIAVLYGFTNWNVGGNKIPTFHQANLYLTKVVKSAQGLEIAMRLLHSPEQEEIWQLEKAFASTVLYEKTLKPLNEPIEQIFQLSQKLFMQLMQNQNENQQMIPLKLSLSLVCLIYRQEQFCNAHNSPVQFLTYLADQTPVHDQISQNPSDAFVRRNIAILSILHVFPEEIQNNRVSLSKDRRSDCVYCIYSSTVCVLQFLSSLLVEINRSKGNLSVNEIQQRKFELLIMKCLKSWIANGQVSPVYFLENKSLLEWAFNGCLNENLSEISLGAIEELIRRCNSQDFIPLMEEISKGLVILGRLVCENNITSSLEYFVQVLSLSGQYFIPYLFEDCSSLSNNSPLYQYLENVLQFTRCDNFEISKLTIDFWINFRSFVSGKSDQHIELLDPYIIQVLQIFVDRSQYPCDYEASSIVRKEAFEEYRKDARQLFRALATSSKINEVHFINSAINGVLIEYSNVQTIRAENWWVKIEVYLHALSSVARVIPSDESEYMHKLFSCLTQCVSENVHPALCKTIGMFLSVSCHWFFKNRSSLHHALKILSTCFSFPEEDSKCGLYHMRSCEDHIGAVALLKLTLVCKEALYCPEWLVPMMKVYYDNVNSESNKKIILHDGSQKVVLSAILCVLSHVSYEQSSPFIRELLLFLLQKIDSLGKLTLDSVKSLHKYLGHLEMISLDFKCKISQDFPHPIVSVFDDKWEVFEVLFIICGSNEEVMDHLCNVLCNLFISTRSQAMVLSPKILDILGKEYPKHFSPGFIRIVTSIIPCVSESTDDMNRLTDVLHFVVKCGMSLITSPEKINEFPDVVRNTFELVICCGTHRPICLAQSECLSYIFEIAYTTIICVTDSTLSEVLLKFYVESCKWYSNVLRIPDTLRRHDENRGSVFLFECMKSYFIDSSQACIVLKQLVSAVNVGEMKIDHICGILHEFFDSFGKTMVLSWLRICLEDSTFPKPNVPNTVKEEFLNALDKTDTFVNERKFKRVIKSFCGSNKK